MGTITTAADTAGYPIAHPIAASKKLPLTSINSDLGSANDGVQQDTTGSTTQLTFLGGLGRFRRTKPAAQTMTAPGRKNLTQIAQGGRNDQRHTKT